MSWKVLLTIFFLKCVVSMELPNWKSIQEKLHEKLEDIYNDRDEVRKTVDVGKYFKYYLPGVGSFQAVEEGSNVLPNWLTFDSDKNKLHGVPTEHDVQKGLRIKFKGSNGRDKKVLILNIVKRNTNFGCPDALTIASVVFHDDLRKTTGKQRVKFLRDFARHFDASINDLYIEYGNRMDNDGLLTSNLRIAGPGDKSEKIVGDQPGFTVSWKLLCGYNIEDHPDIGVLRTFTKAEDFTQLNKPVLGWLITSTKTNRNRRAAGVGATPGVTPSVSVKGTPTLVPSASVDVKTSMKIQVTPTKSSMVMMRTSSVLPPVVVTDPPTTTTTTTTTTTEETTQQPTTTTEEPTTTEKPTGKPTQPPTTRKPTANRKPVINPDHKFNSIQAQEQHPTMFQVPFGLFNDDDKLKTSLLYKNDADYVDKVPSWIVYRREARTIYIFPNNQDAGEHQFALKAKDTGGLIAKHFFKVVVKKDQVAYDFQFNMTLDMDYVSFADNAIEKVKLIKHIAKALGYSNTNRFKNVKFSKGSVVVVWGDSQFANASSCNNPELIATIARLDNVGNMAEKMLPYTLVSTGMTSVSGCTTVSNTEEEPAEGLLERILIPVIVIVIILLIIALILCCVYRRKKKYEPQTQDETYLNQKKPVIFLEEYEEKPDFLSLKPLVLPNEKPPADGYGPESSTTASTEDDETAPLAPNSPKESRNGYNAPPPYTAR